MGSIIVASHTSRISASQRLKRKDGGFTLLELLVALLISSVVLLAAFSSFSLMSRLGSDAKLKVTAQLQAQAALEMMVAEFRMIGNGVPFHQANFLIGEETLADPTVTQPIMVTGTTANQIKFRLNETGETYIVYDDFNPASTTTISLTSVTKISVGSQVYITNSTVGEDDGLWGTVSALNSGANPPTITLAAGFQYSPGATFGKGSLLEVVPVVTYASGANYGGITRDNGSGVQTLVPTAQFTLDYRNSAGASITLPLIATPDDPFPASAIQNVHAIAVTVQVKSPINLSNGQTYVASVTQTVGVRNLNYRY